MASAYPIDSTPAVRTRWILEKRGPKRMHDPLRPYAFFAEDEIDAAGEQAATATLFLTNRECPYRCLMCDLWQDTLDEPTGQGAIPAQIAYALERLPACRQIKLYNSGSFFDPKAIPPEDYPEIARLTAPFERVIVECHPALIGKRMLAFRDLIAGQLEVAIGLETVHPVALERLNKRFDVDCFRRAAAFLRSNRVDLRVFLLVRPPYLSEEEGVEWAKRSLDVSFECGATACTLIPVRAGNGAMELLQASGEWAPPRLSSVEAAQEYGISLGQGRVFVDLWDADKQAGCVCAPARIARMAEMNKTQRVPAPVRCKLCQTGCREAKGSGSGKRATAVFSTAPGD